MFHGGLRAVAVVRCCAGGYSDVTAFTCSQDTAAAAALPLVAVLPSQLPLAFFITAGTFGALYGIDWLRGYLRSRRFLLLNKRTPTQLERVSDDTKGELVKVKSNVTYNACFKSSGTTATHVTSRRDMLVCS